MKGEKDDGAEKSDAVFAKVKPKPGSVPDPTLCERAKVEVEKKLDDAVWSIVPEMVKDLPDPLMWRFAFFILVVFVVLFLYFLYSVLKSGFDESFISLDKDAGICSKVERSVTSPVPYIGTTTGVWQGDKAFKFKDGSYLLTLSSFDGNNSVFKTMFDHFASDLDKYYQYGTSALVTYNAIVWMSFYSSYVQNNFTQVMRLSGDPRMLFNPSYAYGGVATSEGICYIPNFPKFDVSTSVYTVSYIRSAFYAEDNPLLPVQVPLDPYGRSCADFMPALASNSLQLPSTDQLTWFFQMESFTTTLAVNLGILPLNGTEFLDVGYYQDGQYVFELETFTTVDDDYFFYDDKATHKVNDTFIFRTVTDSKYPGSDPSLCFDPNDGINVYMSNKYGIKNPFCLVNFMNSFQDEKVFALPVFIPQGDTAIYYDVPPISGYQCPPCGSTDDTFTDDDYNDDDYNDDDYNDDDNNYGDDKAQTRSEYCNQFFVYYGILTWNNINDFFSFLQKYDYDFNAINTASFDAQFWATNGPFVSVSDSTAGYVNVQYQDEIKESFAFCDYKCSYIGMNNVPLDGQNKLLNSYYKKITEADCASEVYNKTEFDKLAKSPPVVLTEQYYECKNTAQKVILDGVGLASSNAGTYIPLLVLILLPLTFQFLKLTGQETPRKEYTKEEKEEALDELVVQLLRARDGKTKNFSAQSLVKSLAKDLKTVGQSEPEYPEGEAGGLSDFGGQDGVELGSVNPMNAKKGSKPSDV